MRKLLAGSVIILTLFLLSCQKEIDWGLGGSNNPYLLLVKIKSKTGADTTQIDYYYNAGKKLIREKTTGVSAGNSLDNDLIINRNSSGIITTTVQKAAALVAVGIDSVVTRFNYNSATSKYTSSVFDLAIPGFSVTDSAVYTYDANNRITSDAHYLVITGLPIPIPPTLALVNSYKYSGGGANLDSVKQDAATIPGGPLSLVATQAFTFDTKTNPLIILNEAILIGRVGLYNANNATKAEVTDVADPTQDFDMIYTFKYNNVNKPDSSTGTRMPGGAITATKYYYQ
ncbi:MAG: hypothetical protein ACRDEB_02485 [Chitinophagaceae bacterium]